MHRGGAEKIEVKTKNHSMAEEIQTKSAPQGDARFAHPSLVRLNGLSSEGVADRDARPRGVIVAEFEVVADEVETGFGPDEDIVQGIKLDAYTHVS